MCMSKFKINKINEKVITYNNLREPIRNTEGYVASKKMLRVDMSITRVFRDLDEKDFVSKLPSVRIELDSYRG